MFHSNYPFFSSLSAKMKDHFSNHVNSLISNGYIKKDSFVIEIGCNDGVLLQNIANKNILHLGIEPSSNVAQIAKSKNINVLNDFFNLNSAKTIIDKYKKVNVALAANVICHIPDMHELIKSLDLILDDKGVFIFEEPYLGDMISKVSYDQIYDEHIYVFSLMAIQNLFKMYDFELFHAEHLTTHGGSMRYYISRKNKYPITKNLELLLENEYIAKLDKIETFRDFSINCEKSKENTLKMIDAILSENKKIVGYGATSKSTTVLNYCNINSEKISHIVDTTPIKQGKFSPGMHIPIIDYNNFNIDYPDYAFLFAWNHKNEIYAKEESFFNNGGKFISHVNLDD